VRCARVFRYAFLPMQRCRVITRVHIGGRANVSRYGPAGSAIVSFWITRGANDTSHSYTAGPLGYARSSLHPSRGANVEALQRQYETRAVLRGTVTRPRCTASTMRTRARTGARSMRSSPLATTGRSPHSPRRTLRTMIIVRSVWRDRNDKSSRGTSSHLRPRE